MKKVLIMLIGICLSLSLSGCGFQKMCDDGDILKGKTCIQEHISDAQVEYQCLFGYYLKNGRCYHNILDYTGVTMTPQKKYYCSSGYLRDNKCVVETTYDAYIDFFRVNED